MIIKRGQIITAHLYLNSFVSFIHLTSYFSFFQAFEILSRSPFISIRKLCNTRYEHRSSHSAKIRSKAPSDGQRNRRNPFGPIAKTRPGRDVVSRKKSKRKRKSRQQKRFKFVKWQRYLRRLVLLRYPASIQSVEKGGKNRAEKTRALHWCYYDNLILDT